MLFISTELAYLKVRAYLVGNFLFVSGNSGKMERALSKAGIMR